MKWLSSITAILMLALIVSACGARAPQAAPTIDPLDIQSTSAAVAMTMLAQTQAALPTLTPPPPTPTITNTAPPTPTFLPLPSPGGTVTAAAAGGSGGNDPCIHQVLPASLQGKTIKIRINNSTNAALAVSIYLNQTAPQGQCGYRTYTLEPQQSLVLNDLVEGCYTLWAWNPVPEDYFIVTNGTSCLDDSSPWAFDISTRRIELRT